MSKELEIVPEKELLKIIDRCNSYIHAKIDIKMHEQIIALIEEVRKYRNKK
jgi:hypothetical protein